MDARQDLDLRSHLGMLLSGALSLESFRHWFASALWDIEESTDDDTVEFAYLLENRLAEYSGGYVTDAELIAGLRADFLAHFGSESPDAGSTAKNLYDLAAVIGSPVRVPRRRAGTSARTLWPRTNALGPAAIGPSATGSAVMLHWTLSAGARPAAPAG